MRMIDADWLLEVLNGIISDYTSEGKYPNGFGIDDAINLIEEAPTFVHPSVHVSHDANKYENLVLKLREGVQLADTDPNYGMPESLILQAAFAIETLLDEVEQAEKLTWISVKDRLPDMDGAYLVYAPTYTGGSSSSLDCIGGIMFSRFKYEKWSIESGYYKRPNCVTHWMPIPTPYDIDHIHISEPHEG